MKKIINILILALVSYNLAFGQDYCSKEYHIVYTLQQNSILILNNENITLKNRITKSKNIAKQALKIAYQTIENKKCKKYSIIVDRIIELELRLGNKKNAKNIALERLNFLNPNWQHLNGSARASHLSILATISRLNSRDSFYKRVRKNKGIYGVCGNTSHYADVTNLFQQAKELLNKYGNIYCLKFLQNSTILINEDNEGAKLIWNKIYEILIESMNEKYSFDEIKMAYESSQIKKVELSEWPRQTWGIEHNKSYYYFELFDQRIYFKNQDCSNKENGRKRCQPTNLETIKSKAKLLDKINEYAS